MADRNEASREGDVSALTLCEQLLILDLLLHLTGNPELMLRGCPSLGGHRQKHGAQHDPLLTHVLTVSFLSDSFCYLILKSSVDCS